MIRRPVPADRGFRAWDGRERSPSSQDHRGIGEIVVERDFGQPLEGLDVASPRALDDVVGELRTWSGLVPAERLAVVTRELLVVGRLRTARPVALGGPEAWGVRGVGLDCEPE